MKDLVIFFMAMLSTPVTAIITIIIISLIIAVIKLLIMFVSVVINSIRDARAKEAANRVADSGDSEDTEQVVIPIRPGINPPEAVAAGPAIEPSAEQRPIRKTWPEYYTLLFLAVLIPILGICLGVYGLMDNRTGSNTMIGFSLISMGLWGIRLI